MVSIDSTAYTTNTGTVTSVGLSSATSGVTIGSTPITTSGTITLAIATASGSQNGLLSSTDWTTFNNKQNALTNAVTGTGTTNYLPKFTGASTIGNSIVQDNGSTITVGGSAYIKAGNGNQLGLDNSGERFTQISFNNNTTSKANIWWDNTNTELVLLANSVGSGHLRIASTGEANFSSSVTAATAINVTGNGGFFNAANKFGLDHFAGASRFYSSGSNSSTKGGYEFHTNSSDGSLDVIALGIASTGAATFSSSVGVSVTPAAVSKLQVNVASNVSFSIRNAVDVSGVQQLFKASQILQMKIYL
jgi:hypothetical protein